MMQKKQREWLEQWKRFKDSSLFLFQEWIHPNRLEDFQGKRVLDAGCGHGHHALMAARYAEKVVGVDLNAAEVARAETKDLSNIEIVEADLAAMDFREPFDVVYCIGVIHHTDDPDRTFENLKRLTRKGGRLIVWAYSHEGNWLNRVPLETLKRIFLLRLPTGMLVSLSYVLTLLIHPLVWTVYLLPLRFLPYYEYFENWRILPFGKNVQNVFDKLNAPQTDFIRRERIERWFSPADFREVHISPYKGVSWRGSGTKR
ncbi:MAG: hypothetical protein A2X36_17080 [Elusimicrobia bacterium GWA2_69_24]|nr:MAG: hypothetical protein A2X36_17080 [Elusimicrobia bacterium GWA2_69_24]HBL16243.1 hypothetical protein [Elusimicrobiota bacterium]